MDNNITDIETAELIDRVKAWDNDAWEKLYKIYEKFIHKRGWVRLKDLNLSSSRLEDMENDLFMAGWQGFISYRKIQKRNEA